MRILYNIIFSSLLLGIFTACSDRPQNIASDKKMVKVLADMQVAEAYAQRYGYSMGDNQHERIAEYVLNKNGITRQEYDSTISWYGRNLDKYDELYDKVDKELASRAKKLSGITQEIESIDLWPYSRGYILSPLSNSDNLVFDIRPNNSDKGNRFIWKFRVNPPLTANTLLGVKYTDGSYGYINKTLHGFEHAELQLQSDSSKNVERIFGNLRFKNLNTHIYVDSIYLEVIPFDSTEYYKVHSLKHFIVPQHRFVKVKADSLSHE